jgi:hypothetical protein
VRAEIACEVAGHLWPLLLADPRVSRCGGIEDGVALAFARTPDGTLSDRTREGGWVVSFSDLKRIYQAAARARRRARKPRKVSGGR